jgi:curved DNA-binding protein CbpA
MNYKDAFEILEIDFTSTKYEDLSLEYLTKQYRKLALKNHPDKNGNTNESKEKFQQINEAYHYLKREMKHFNYDDIEHDIKGDDDDSVNSSLYSDILKGFMKTVFEGKYNELLTKIVNDIITAGKRTSVKLFDDLDKDTALNIYTFLSNNRSILHLSQEILDVIREIVVKKYDNVDVYKLNPSINDLINNNLYKLHVNDELYLVPLWHNESYFDGSGCEIIVICEPELPEGIQIDDDNNLIVCHIIDAKNELPEMLINNTPLTLNIGEKIHSISLCNLYIKREQYYRIKNEGLSKVKRDIYDVSEKSDIIVKVVII